MAIEDESKIWHKQTPERIMDELQDNHLWLNALSCINPSEEFLQKVGLQILAMLNQTELRDSMGISPTVLLRINKS